MREVAARLRQCQRQCMRPVCAQRKTWMKTRQLINMKWPGPVQYMFLFHATPRFPFPKMYIHIIGSGSGGSITKYKYISKFKHCTICISFHRMPPPPTPQPPVYVSVVRINLVSDMGYSYFSIYDRIHIIWEGAHGNEEARALKKKTRYCRRTGKKMI